MDLETSPQERSQGIQLHIAIKGIDNKYVTMAQFHLLLRHFATLQEVKKLRFTNSETIFDLNKS